MGDAAAARANAPQLVSVNTPTRADKDRLVALGVDLTEHGGKTALGVVLHGAEDEAKLRAAGFSWRVLVDDLVAEQAARDRRRPAVATTLPSGRTSYRQLVDYETELKTLAAQNPGFVRLFTLPNKTFEGREVLGIEITENVALNDGKPAFLNMGVHHAREWPAGELTMEWAYELINGYKAGDPRATRIVQQSRNLVVPIVNPDGFNGSRSVGSADGNDEATDDTVYIISKPARVPAQELPRRRDHHRAVHRSRSAWRRTAWTRTATTPSSGAAPAPTATRSPRPTAARRPSRSPSRATSSGSSPATR